MRAGQLEAVGAAPAASWADCLDAAGLERVNGLIAPAALARVMALGATLPALPGGGLECHLTDRERVDAAVRLLPDDGGRDALLGRHETLRFAPALLSYPQWPRLRALGERWVASGTPENRELTSLWLEFDLPAAGSVSVPSLFIGCRPLPSQERPEPGWIAESAALLAGPQGAAAVRAGLQRWNARAPAGAQLAFVGLMLSRQEKGVRLVHKGLDIDTLYGQVMALGWCGDGEAMLQALRQLVPEQAALALHCDFSPDLGPRIGVEIALPGHPRYTPGWQQLLQGLVGHGVCTEAAAAALTQWPGLTAAGDEAWRGRPFAPPRGIVRRINHIKLTFEPEQPIQAKAYLYCGLL